MVILTPTFTYRVGEYLLCSRIPPGLANYFAPLVFGEESMVESFRTCSRVNRLRSLFPMALALPEIPLSFTLQAQMPVRGMVTPLPSTYEAIPRRIIIMLSPVIKQIPTRGNSCEGGGGLLHTPFRGVL